MKKNLIEKALLVTAFFSILFAQPVLARVKLVALPERGAAVIRMENPRATLIEEERVLTLQKGINKVDFSWKGVSIDEDSIRLKVLSHPYKATLLAVSYPPDEDALVWDIHSDGALEVAVRISYLLSNIDRLIKYRAIADQNETGINLKGFLVIRNFSGEEFEKALVFLDQERAFAKSIRRNETKQLLLFEKKEVTVQKVWTFDAGIHPWDPESENAAQGIPVVYRISNDKLSNLGGFDLLAGKIRIFQQDGHGSSIFLGEDSIGRVPVGEKIDIYIGDSRDIVVTQRKMKEKRINIRRNSKNRTVLYDTDEMIKAKIENFKKQPATLTMIQHIPGQWDMLNCSFEYNLRDANTVEFRIDLPPGAKKELIMHYNRRNVR